VTLICNCDSLSDSVVCTVHLHMAVLAICATYAVVGYTGTL